MIFAFVFRINQMILVNIKYGIVPILDVAESPETTESGNRKRR